MPFSDETMLLFAGGLEHWIVFPFVSKQKGASLNPRALVDRQFMVTRAARGSRFFATEATIRIRRTPRATLGVLDS